jgi:TetR/AcrR family transcriptional regulator, ethionamide resistance regulator
VPGVTVQQALRGLRGRRPGRPSGDDREAAIVATLEQLVAERPLGAISVDDLARGAGISRPTFYFYFSSKDAVLLTLLDGVIAEADAASAAAFAGPATDRRRRWRDGIEAYHRTFRAHRAVTVAAVEAATGNPEVQALWARAFEGWVRNCAATIDAERRRGAAPPGVPARDLAVVLNAMNERALYATFSGKGPAVAEDDVVDVLLEVWLAAIYGGSAPPRDH